MRTTIPGQPALAYLLGGSLLFLVTGIIVTTGLPGWLAPPPSPGARQYTPEEALGRRVYIREGCGYCHTQQVRAPEAEHGYIMRAGDIGPESQPGDYAYQAPVLWGTERQGPDLTFTARRHPDREWHLAHLRDPQAIAFGSIMPAFAHLPDAALEALSTYLLTLQ